MGKKIKKKPTVSIITITQFNRHECLKILVELINKQTYILDKNFLYTIEHNKKGELYGSLVNGKFRRLRSKDIEV